MLSCMQVQLDIMPPAPRVQLSFESNVPSIPVLHEVRLKGEATMLYTTASPPGCNMEVIARAARGWSIYSFPS